VARSINIELLRKLIRYNAETGKLYWLERPTSMFHCARLAKDCADAWNNKLAGKEAFTSITSRGYRQGRIFGQQYIGHRVAWAIYYGEWPDFEIDHINGVRSDNRLENLRAVTPAENRRNIRTPSHNTSGVMGVVWNKQYGKWQAQIGVAGKNINLGRYSNFAEAVAARKTAETTYNFHANHGRNS
jgi:hypothetical protein